jgi:hypothetical protein
MRPHPYLRAYLAGIFVPTLFLLVIMTLVSLGRYVHHLPVPVERLIVFPMAVVPNLWGAWNMLYLFLRDRRHLPLGVHGAILPFLLAPAGYAVARLLDFPIPEVIAGAVPIAFPVAVIVYYLVWKHAVGFLNEMLGIA